jgi:hypothetical protein
MHFPEKHPVLIIPLTQRSCTVDNLSEGLKVSFGKGKETKVETSTLSTPVALNTRSVRLRRWQHGVSGSILSDFMALEHVFQFPRVEHSTTAPPFPSTDVLQSWAGSTLSHARCLRLGLPLRPGASLRTGELVLVNCLRHPCLRSTKAK